MNDPQRHPSFLQLDRHCLGAVVEPSLVEHLAQCERCAGYVAGYVPAASLPHWLPTDGARSVAPRRRRTQVPRRLFAAAAIMAAASFLLLWAWPERHAAYDGVKGSPSALVHVLGDGATRIWHGEPLAAGEKIRLEVQPDGFDHVSVFSLSEHDRPPVVLYAGRVRPHVSSLLPKAWELDGTPEPEALAIMFGHAVISPQGAEVLLRARDPREVWVVRLRLPKETRKK